jgi:hypothetical protein
MRDVLCDIVMPGLVPGIHVLLRLQQKGSVDGRDEPDHDGCSDNRARLSEMAGTSPAMTE